MATRTLLETHRHPAHPRLSVDLRADSRFYQGRTYLDGKQWQWSTKTDQLKTALKLAEDKYKKLIRSSVAVGKKHPTDKLTTAPTVSDILRSYKQDQEKRKHDEIDKRWGPIADFWRTIEVEDVTTQTCKTFYEWRRKRNPKISNHTLHKDITLIRQVLKHAIQEGHISNLPIIPKTGKIDANPRPWLTRSEWQHLRTVSEARIEAAWKTNQRLLEQRVDLDDQINFMVGSMVRVGEMLSLRHRDCRIENNAAGARIVLCEVTGKRGVRTVVGRPTAAKIIEHRRKDANDPNALVFPIHHRDAFTELLKAAELHKDSHGFTRNMKSLRATAISLRILESSTPNLLLIARNAGTSLAMIDTFYSSRLSAEMGKEDLTARRKPKRDE